MAARMSFPGGDPVAARRALAFALAEYLDTGGVREAVLLWAQHFEGQGSLFVGLSRYCRQIAERFGLAGREAELHLKIFRALQADPQQLPEDPLSLPPSDGLTTTPAWLDPRPAEAAAVPSSGPAATVQAGAGARTLQAFFAAVEEQLARDTPPGLTPARLRRTLIRHAPSLPRPQQQAASLWWSGQVGSLGGEWPAGGHGTTLVNVIYVTLAELVGPARADRCFTLAVQRLTATRDATLAEIRRYL